MNLLKRFLLGLTLAAGLLIPAIALAEPAADSNTANEVLREFTALLSIFLTFLNYLLYPLLIVIGALMDNEIIIGPAMEEKLLAIWVEIRNWVNMTFVLVLVGIALYNVLGIAGDGSNYALKSILPKIVIGLVAVNFSFLAGKLLIDTTAVLTNAVYALPQSASLIEWDKEAKEMRIQLCMIPKEKLPLDEANAYERAKEDASVLALLLCEAEPEGDNLTGEYSEFGKSFFSHFGQHNVAVAMIVQMGNVSSINTPGELGLKTISEITFKTLFNIFLLVMFGFAYAALIVVLVARVVVLWIVLALSPVVVLLFVLPDLSSALGGEFDLKKKFFQHLVAPLVIGVVFSIGFVMLNTLQENGAANLLGSIGNINFQGIQDTDQAIQLAATYGQDLSNFQSLLIAIGAVLIIWMGVFGAAKETVASGIVESIKGAGQKFGKFMGKLPLYATVIPVHKGGPEISLGGLLAAPGLAMQAHEQKVRDKQRKAYDGLFGPRDSIRKSYDNTYDKIKTGTLDEGRSALAGHLRYNEALNSPEDVKKLGLELIAKLPDKNLAARLKTDLEGKNGSEVINWFKEPSGGGVLMDTHHKPTEIGTRPIGTEGEAGASAADASQPDPKLQAATNRLARATTALGTNAAALNDVQTALDDGNITNDVKMGTLFTMDRSEADMNNRLTIFKSQDDAIQKTILGGITPAGGKIQASDFIAAVDAHAATARGGGAPGAGGTPPPAGPGPAPGAPATP